MVHFDDIKVLGANTVCMVLAKIHDMNGTLQSILFFATIAYTVVRTVNEINKLKKDKTDESI
jgi:fucose permease